MAALFEICIKCEFYNQELAKQTSIYNQGNGCEHMKHTGRYALVVNGKCNDFRSKNDNKEIKDYGTN